MTTNFDDGYRDAMSKYGNATEEEINAEYRRYAFGLTGFWYIKKRGDPAYKVILTRYDKGYLEALSELLDARRGEK